MAEVAISAAKVESDFCMLSGEQLRACRRTIIGESSQQTVGQPDDGSLSGQAAVSDLQSSAYKHPTIAMMVSNAIWRRYVLLPDMLPFSMALCPPTWAPG